MIVPFFIFFYRDGTRFFFGLLSPIFCFFLCFFDQTFKRGVWGIYKLREYRAREIVEKPLAPSLFFLWDIFTGVVEGAKKNEHTL